MTKPPYYSFKVADLPEQIFHTKEQLQEWLETEQERWSWLWTEEPQRGTLKTSSFNGVGRAFDNVINKVEADSSQSITAQQAPTHPNVNNMILHLFLGNQQNRIFPSESAQGTKLLDIHKGAGADSARWHYMFATRQKNMQQLQSPEDLALVFQGLVYDDEWAGDIGDTLKQERTNYRKEITQLSNKIRELEAERIDDRKQLKRTMLKLGKKHLARYRDLWETGEQNITSRIDAAINSIEDTEAKYRKQMRLQAPVEYWRKKALSHGRWEIFYALVTAVFFVVAGWAILEMASAAINFFTNYPDQSPVSSDQTSVSSDDTPSPLAFSGQYETSAFIVISAALLAGTSLIFWLGRVIIKLFLSEHHLRAECGEKAVMTEAYLSLTHETNELSETERSIILASIFRSSPDGIVKEDGPVDFGAAAIMGKALSR